MVITPVPISEGRCGKKWNHAWKVECLVYNKGSFTLAAAAAAKSLQSFLTLCYPKDGSPPGSHPWDSPGKNTGVGCHFLLQCMKVKSESEITQLCLTLSDPMDCSLPGSSIHGIFQARVLEWVAIAFSKEPVRSLLISAAPPKHEQNSPFRIFINKLIIRN